MPPRPCSAVVYGAGFEDRPELLTLIAKRLAAARQRRGDGRAAQGAGELLRRARPARHSASCARRRERPGKGAGWLAKREGGAGGSHIVPSRLKRDARATSITRSASRAARSRRCSSPMAATRACSASASNGRRRRRAAPSAMAARCAPPRCRKTWRGGWPQRSERVARCFKIVGLASRRLPGRRRRRRFCSRSIRVPAPRSIFSTAAQQPLLASHLDAILDGQAPSRRQRNSMMPWPRQSSMPLSESPCRRAWSGPTGPPTGLSRRNGSTKTVRYALCWPAAAHEHRPSAWSRSEFAKSCLVSKN